TTYFWRVRSKNGSNISPFSEVFSFTTLTPLAAPTLISPANNAVNQLTNLTFDWSDVTGAAEYEYQYSNNSNFTAAITGTVTASQASITGLDNATTYFWRVRSKNGSNISPFSEVFSFTTLTPLAAPTLISPANNAVNQTTNLTFDWADVTGAAEYEYQYSTNSNFTAAITGTVTASQASITGLDNATTYFWRVRSKNGSNISPFSEVFSFTTLTPLSAPTLISPANNAVNQTTNLIFDWSDVTGAAEYEYQYSNNSNFTAAITGTVAASQASITGLDNATTYFWRVRSKNGNTISEYSSVFSFTTDSNIGVNPAIAAQISIWPVPATEVINIKTEENQAFNYLMYDAAGKVVAKGNAQNSVSIKVADLAAGVYQLRLQTANNVVVRKISVIR
ncbi:Por secretion system C-terminal sorting domain-containing protein, partial [Flexibacter flexilis DSM 6793]